MTCSWGVALLEFVGCSGFLTTLLNYCVIAKKLYTTQIYKFDNAYILYVSIVS